MFVIASKVLKAAEFGDGIYHLALQLISPGGEVKGLYRRSHPNPPGVEQFLMPGKTIGPGEEIPVFETDRGNFGLQICSELWLPEISRIQALKGADVLFAPIGGCLYELIPSWRILVQARAIENLAYVVVSQNIWGKEDGLGMIAGRRASLAESKEPGVIVADLDLDRLAWLRDGGTADGHPQTLPSHPRHPQGTAALDVRYDLQTRVVRTGLLSFQGGKLLTEKSPRRAIMFQEPSSIDNA